MSTPIFKASIPLSNPLFHSLHPVPWTSAVNGISKKEKLLLLSGAQLSPVNYDSQVLSSGKHMLLPPQSTQLPCKVLFFVLVAAEAPDPALLVIIIFWSFRIVAMLEGNGMLKFANVGDRGLKLIREEVLANLARVHSLDSSYESPYALEARVLSYHGGKRSLACNLQARQTFCFSYFNIYGVFDDITVIVG
ncbi:unnamed protein product [Linum tenue]|uniref:Uncharacterized protein n=1 Tax=Linum tenue TaxID=586396 RepID=A0AAV0IT06_9ROSI|nr:unnamed protein product [Linum tenue]